MIHRTRHRQLGLHHVLARATAAGIAVALASGAIVAAAPKRAPMTPRSTPRVVAISSTGITDANRPSISADGRWVVFGGTVEGRESAFLTDGFTNESIELSLIPAGVRDGDTVHPRISADGCVVAAITQLPLDLFRDNDRSDRWDVYRLVLPHCGGQPDGWELVSTVDRAGMARDDVFVESAPALSGSGALIAYGHQALEAPEGVATITVVDITVPINEPGRVEEVAGIPVEAPGGAFLYRGARQPVLSQNGRHLAFVSDTTASEALPGWGQGPDLGGDATSQVYVWDRLAADQRRAVRLVSGRDGVPSTTGADDPDLSEDGRIVVFTSRDRTLVTAELPDCDAECASQVYRFDRDTDGNGIFDEPPRRSPLAIVSAVDAGKVATGVPVAANDSAWSPAVNADGSQIAFVTDSTNLVPSRRGGGGGPDDGDLLVAEFHLGQIRRVLDGTDATAVPGAHGNPALSKTGGIIVFDTAAAAALSGAPADAASRGRTVLTKAVTPQLSLAALDFGTVLVGFESTELRTNVLNAGPAAFEPASVETSSPNFRITGGTCRAGIIVAAGTSCSVKLTFNPTAPGPFAGTLTVRGNGLGAASATTAIRGAGGEPMLLANPGGVDFPRSIVGSVGGRKALDIGNIGFSPTSVVGLEVGGANAADFRIVSQSCTDRALNPDAKCAVEIEFLPRGPGYRSALLIATGTTPLGNSYTTAVLGGFARYAPTFVKEKELPIRPGTAFGVGGFGFPANAEVKIGFDDGSAPFATVTSSPDGTFLAQLTLPVRVRIGPRTLVATSSGGVVVGLSIDVLGRIDRSMPVTPGYGTG